MHTMSLSGTSERWLVLLCIATTAIGSTDDSLRFTGWRDPIKVHHAGRYEKGTHMLHKQAYRFYATSWIAAHEAEVQHVARPALPVGDIYQFGVYTGGGMRAWAQALGGQKLTHFAQAFNGTMWGFDSFQGMPDEPEELKTAEQKTQKGQLVGGLNAAEEMGIHSWAELSHTLVNNIGYIATKFVRGFFNESLVGGAALARAEGMRPAFLVDIDVDLRSSTVQALEFLLDAGLLQIGSYLFYDDIGTILAWDGMAEPEKTAHVEVSRKYGLNWTLVSPRRQKGTKWANNWRPVLQLVHMGGA